MPAQADGIIEIIPMDGIPTWAAKSSLKPKEGSFSANHVPFNSSQGHLSSKRAPQTERGSFQADIAPSQEDNGPLPVYSKAL